MNKTIQFILGVITVLIAAAFLAPLLSSFIPYEFDRILSRTVLVLLVGWLIFFVCRSGGLDFKKYGLFWEVESGKRLLTAFLLGFTTLLVLSLIEIPFGVRSWQFTFYQIVWPLKLLKYIVSAFFVGLLEEFIFRGFLFRTLSPKIRLIPALLLTNVIYSLVHFLRYSGTEIFTHPTFLSSLQVYVATLAPFAKLAAIWPGAIGLFIFGMVLSYAYLKTENLVFSIGLHAGCVFFLKMDRWFIHVESETHKIWFGGTDFHASILGWIAILLMGVVIRQLFGKQIAK